MASSGGVAAGSNQEAAKCSAGTAPAPNAVEDPKPEVARKPHAPGSKNKIRPPVPKKPPLAQKPSAICVNNGSSGVKPDTLSSLPNHHDSGDTSLPVAEAFRRQGQLPGLRGSGAAAAKQKSGNRNPPPLPQSPPRGPEQPAKKGRELPPRPSQLSAPRQSLPPLPTKRPVGGVPLTSVPKQKHLSCSEQTVKENSLNAVDNVHKGRSEGSPPIGKRSSTQRSPAYQQVVVEVSSEEIIETTQSTADSGKDSSPQNKDVAVKRKSPNTLPESSTINSPRSYDHVLVAENRESDSDASIKNCATSSSERSDCRKINQRSASTPNLKPRNLLSCGLHSNILKQTSTADANQVMLGDHCVSRSPLLSSKDYCGDNTDLTSTTEDSERESEDNVKDSQSASTRLAESLDKDDGQNQVDIAQENLKSPSEENPSKRKISRPPPVRPKPKKRVSLLRQSLVKEEKPNQESILAATAGNEQPLNLTDNCVPHAEPQGSSVQEAVYEYIDEGEQSGQTSNETSVNCYTESSLNAGTANSSPGQSQKRSCESGSKDSQLAQTVVQPRVDQATKTQTENKEDFSRITPTEQNSLPRVSGRSSPAIATQKGSSVSLRKSEKHAPTVLPNVGETSSMLQEIERLLNARLGSEENIADTCCTFNPITGQTEDTPIRPPRPRRADKLRKLTVGSCSLDSSSTESLTGIGLTGRKAPPKPKRKSLPGCVTRSCSDVTGMKSFKTHLNSDDDDDVEKEEKPFLPPRQESLQEPRPPPLPPRNKSMERIADDQNTSCSKSAEAHLSEGEQVADRRASVPNSGTTISTKIVRSMSGGRSGKKHVPRPTRKAPPPPSQPHNALLSLTPSPSCSSSTAEKVPGYQKIINGSGSVCDDINTVVPKTAVVGSLDSPTADVSIYHDYHEISDHMDKDDAPDVTEQMSASAKLKEETPPPDLPPRSYKPPLSRSSTSLQSNLPKETCSDKSRHSTDCSVPNVLKPSGSVLSSQEKIPDQLSAEDSASQSSLSSSRPESFSPDVLGSLRTGFDRHRPFSSESCSSHSETGSGEVDVPVFDHSSASESENEDDEEKMRQKRERKVYYIAEEVVKSEQVFVDVLKLLNVDFRVFMSNKTEQAGHAIVPTETLNKILDFLPQLQSFNEMLLKDLTDRIANWDNQKKIADIFVKKGPFLKLYSSYIRNFEHATGLLDEACKKHGSFGMALQQFEMTPRCANLALKHYMLKPIQRIPQYKLLLQDYLKHLMPESPDYKDTITALNIVSEVADHANESMRHGDTVQKLLEIQRSLIGQFEVIQPGRILIKQGELMKLSRKDKQPRMFFLFSDVLLYTTPTPTATGYRLNNILPLQGMKVVPPKLEEFKNEFNIISTQRSFTLAASSPEERENWLRALWNAIEENSERYHTFKAMQPEPKTSLLDKDFVLGTKAPLWVPDARVTMCMLCLAEFSITWRRHHCRACGRIICGNCSENKAPLRYLLYKPGRVCEECFRKLAAEVEKQLAAEEHKPDPEDTGTTPAAETTAVPISESPAGAFTDTHGLNFSSIKARFQKLRRSARGHHKSRRARVLQEVHANDEGSDMSGYLWVAKNKKWKRLWFVVKGKVLYTYRASEDMAAIESMPLLGFEVTRLTSWYQGAEPDLMFELQHQNTQPLIFKPRANSNSSDRNSASEDSTTPSPSALSPHIKSSTDTTTPRLVFRTDSAPATTKWVTVLREASLA